MTDRLIAVTGFMASGKTTVGRALAAKLNCEFVDLDELIASQHGRTIKEIIETSGEKSFRDIETKALAAVLQESNACVIALGGGTWTIAENRNLLQNQNARVVWLDVPFELCWQRIMAKQEERPLAPSLDIAEKLYRARRPVYEIADIHIAISEQESADALAGEIAAEFSQRKSEFGPS